MTDIATKLKSATEGNRRLSDEVLLACGWKLIPDPGGFLPWPKWFTPEGEYRGDNVTQGEEERRPNVTCSLDAMMTLYEKDRQRDILEWACKEAARNSRYDIQAVIIYGCIAAIKAREQTSPSDSQSS
ncbi:hypothetical protein LCGC14_0231140 [marine sediment metagenome]|uniref:Uncharacterized protein n=1 Tax=marine sediment metagenome TaxID=412755 RepID=A0A0F9UR78_9ZZZZ